MKLVIVESPTKAKTIAKFLGGDFNIESSFGHVRDLPVSKMGIDIEHNFEPKYVVPAKAKKNLKNLQALAKKSDKIILATDEDREGEAIAWHLAEALPRAADLQAMAAEHGVGIYTLQSGAACDFGGCAYSERAIMLGFSSLNERQIRSGIERIAAAVDAARNPANAMASPRRPLPTVSRAHTRPPLANS